MDDIEQPLRQRRITVLAYGEGEDERIFLRHVVSLYCRKGKVAVATSSAGGGTLESIFHQALRFRRGEKRDHEFLLLDTDLGWDDATVQCAQKEGFDLIGNDPCLEAFFLEILDSPIVDSVGSGRCKETFEKLCIRGNFNEDECERLFPKAVLNEARKKIQKLDKIIKTIEGNVSKEGDS